MNTTKVWLLALAGLATAWIATAQTNHSAQAMSPTIAAARAGGGTETRLPYLSCLFTSAAPAEYPPPNVTSTANFPGAICSQWR